MSVKPVLATARHQRLGLDTYRIRPQPQDAMRAISKLPIKPGGEARRGALAAR